MPRLNAKQLTLALIGALILANGWEQGYGVVGPGVAAAALIAIGLDGAVSALRGQRATVPVTALITALIVAGVASSRTPVWQVGAMAAAAIVSKHVIAVRRRNVFNPAAFGLLAGALAFGVRFTWWVDSTHALTVVLGSFLLATFTGRWRMVFAFMATFAALLAARAAISGQSISAMWSFYLGITSFFVFFMATDPKTSPVFPARLPWYAAVVAAGSFLSVVFHPSSVFIGGVLLGNAVTPLLNRPPRRASPIRSATPTVPPPSAG